MADLAGQVAVVTGAGRGLGRATALLLAESGADVALLARSPNQLAETAQAIQATGRRALPLVVDVSSWEQVRQAVKQVFDTFGRVDILINNAGIIDPIAPAHRADPQAWSYNIDVNLKGPFYLVRSIVPHMVAAGRGVVVNVGSGAAHRVVTSWSAYCAAKAGLYHFTNVLATELLGTGVRVNSVRPGVVDTAMQERIRQASPEDFGPENVEHFRRLKEEGHLLPPEYPARLIVWLCTDEAADVHGQEVDIYDAYWRERAGLPPMP